MRNVFRSHRGDVLLHGPDRGPVDDGKELPYRPALRRTTRRQMEGTWGGDDQPETHDLTGRGNVLKRGPGTGNLTASRQRNGPVRIRYDNCFITPTCGRSSTAIRDNV